MTNLKVAVNVSNLNVPNLLDRSSMYQLNMNNNITIFPSCVAQLAIVSAATTDLSTTAAAVAAAGTKKKDSVRDKRKYLVQQIILLGGLVQNDAHNDPAIVHLAGMDIKHDAVRQYPEFSTKQGKTHGSVNLQVKAADKTTIYKWQYSTDNVNWTDASNSDVSKLTISNLTPGTNYWFRVLLIDGAGQHEGPSKSFAVN